MSGHHLTPQQTAERAAQAMCAKATTPVKGLGIDIVSVSPGAATLTMLVRKDMTTAMTRPMAASSFALADTAFAYACNSNGHTTVAATLRRHLHSSGKARRPAPVRTRANFARRQRSGIYDIRVASATRRSPNFAAIPARSAARSSTAPRPERQNKTNQKNKTEGGKNDCGREREALPGLMDGLDAAERASRDEICRCSASAWRGPWRAYENVPHYRQAFDARGVHPEDFRVFSDLAKFPFTVKTDLRDNYPFGLFAVPRDQVIRLHASSARPASRWSSATPGPTSTCGPTWSPGRFARPAGGPA